jgi:glycosyltransferase involved in cell wall biosynthesis
MVLFLFTPVFLFGVIASAHRGFLNGKLAFGAVSAVIIAEAVGKIVIAGGLVAGGKPEWTFVAIPLSLGISALAAWFFSRRLFSELGVTSGDYHFPGQFYAASLISSVSMAVFLSVDIILVKHFLDPVYAGQYVLLSLVGKIIFFLASLPSNFVLTFVSREEGAGRSPRSVFLKAFSITAILAAAGVVALGPFGNFTVPLLFGTKAYAILEHLSRYTVAIGLFALTNVFVVYHLARRNYVFPFASLFMSLAMAVGIWLQHDTIGDVVSVIAAASGFGFVLIGALHLGESHLHFVGRALRDFVEAFVPEHQMPLPAGKRRILVFNWRDIRHTLAGGAEVYIHGMAREWASEGHQVTLFAGNDGQSLREETIDGVHIIRRGGFYFVYLWAFLYYLTQFRRRYDLIIDCHNGVPFFTPLYVGEPVYCVMHHVHQEIFRQYLPRPLAAFARFLERDFMRLVYRNVKIVTVSDSSKEEIESLGVTCAGVDVVSPGVDLSNLGVGEKSATPLVLYLGRLKAYKCIDVLIASFKLVLENAPDANLVIAGEGEERAHLERLVKQLGLEEHTHFAGKVNDAQKLQLLQNAWVLVNPSFMEGWGITTIEANACGTPVIAADVPGLRDSVRNMETGYLVPHGDTHGFASRIISIIEDQRLREEFGERSVVWAQEFAWSLKGRMFLKVIKVDNTG